MALPCNAILHTNAMLKAFSRKELTSWQKNKKTKTETGFPIVF